MDACLANSFLLSDEQFWVAMASCDTVILPYLEVGQPPVEASQAIGLRYRNFLPRTHAFLRSAPCFPNRPHLLAAHAENLEAEPAARDTSVKVRPER